MVPTELKHNFWTTFGGLVAAFVSRRAAELKPGFISPNEKKKKLSDKRRRLMQTPGGCISHVVFVRKVQQIHEKERKVENTIGMGINQVALWSLKMKADMGRKSSRMLKKEKKKKAAQEIRSENFDAK